MLIIGILFIVKFVRGASVIMGWVLGRDSIDSSGGNTSTLVGEVVIYR